MPGTRAQLANAGPLALLAALVERAADDAAGRNLHGLPSVCGPDEHPPGHCGAAFLGRLRPLRDRDIDADPLELALRLAALLGGPERLARPAVSPRARLAPAPSSRGTYPQAPATLALPG